MEENRLKVLLRMTEVESIVKLADSTIYDYIKKGIFPPGIKLGPRCTAWLENEVLQTRDARIRGADDAEIKALVRKLVSARGVPLT